MFPYSKKNKISKHPIHDKMKNKNKQKSTRAVH